MGAVLQSFPRSAVHMKLPSPGAISRGPERACLCGYCAQYAKCKCWLVNADKCLIKKIVFH